MSYIPAKTHFDATEILASAARTATGTGTAVRLPGMANAMAFVLDVTVDESTSADTLDVFIQTKVDGTNWLDVVHFTQHLGNAGAARYISKVTADLATSEFLNSAALGAAAVRNLLGDEWRVRWDVVDDSTSASFTFSVAACPM